MMILPNLFFFNFFRESVLVTAAAGGTGLAAVEIASKVFKSKVVIVTVV